MMSKSLLTNLLALILVIAGYFSPVYSHMLLMTGLFALSGGLTNWLAVHMLFEKVPFLYGSGVIQHRFEDFKKGIKQLIIDEFFTQENIDRYTQATDSNPVESLKNKIDFDHVFEQLTDAIEASPLGGMLGMVGGRKALEPIKEPVTEKLKGIIDELASSENNNDNSLSSSILEHTEQIIDSRLEELTPEKVKHIVQTMIRKHLGWLVVWGAVFGGLIGLGVSVINFCIQTYSY